jgi:hypothetical protein
MVEKWVPKYEVLRAFLDKDYSVKSHGLSMDAFGILVSWGNSPIAINADLPDGKIIVVMSRNHLSSSTALTCNTLVSMAMKEGYQVLNCDDGHTFMRLCTLWRFRKIHKKSDILSELV